MQEDEDDARAEQVVPDSPGRVITGLLLRLGLRNDGHRVAPKVTPEGTTLPLPKRWLDGRGELMVVSVEDGTRVSLRGQPPPWPLRRGWARRTLRRLLA